MINWIIALFRKLRPEATDRKKSDLQPLLGHSNVTTNVAEYEYTRHRSGVPRPRRMLLRKGGRLPISVLPDYVGTAEISRLVGLPAREVRRDIRLGLMPGAIRTARGWSVPTASVKAYLEGPRRPYSARQKKPEN